MEQIKKQNERFISRVMSNILNEFPLEATPNTMCVGGGVGVFAPKCYYKPHNLRLYFDFNYNLEIPLKLPTEIGGGVGSFPMETEFKIINSGKNYVFKHFKGCTILIRKEQIEIINMINPRWYQVDINLEASKRIEEIFLEKLNEGKEVLKEFIKIYGGSSEFKLLNHESEDKIKGTELINKLDYKTRFVNKAGKKVYHKNDFEFLSPVLASNHIENSALISLMPVIHKDLEELKQLIKPPKLESIKDILANAEYIKGLTIEQREALSLKSFTFGQF